MIILLVLDVMWGAGRLSALSAYSFRDTTLNPEIPSLNLGLAVLKLHAFVSVGIWKMELVVVDMEPVRPVGFAGGRAGS